MVKVKASSDGADITIPVRRYLMARMVVSVWLLFWLHAAGVLVLPLVAPGSSPSEGMWIGWSVGFIWLVFVLLRLLFGRERIRLRQGYLSIRKHLLGLGWTRTFELPAVRNTHAVEREPMPWWVQFTGLIFFENQNASVTFEYKGQQIRFGAQLDHSEALAVAKVLQEQISRLNR